MTVLPDTSIWIDYLRGREPTAERMDELLVREPVVLCGPVLSELLAGTRPADRPALWLAFGGLAFVEVGYREWREAGEVAHALRQAGETVPLLDILVALAAIEAQALLWTKDDDVRRVATALPALRLYGET